MELINRAEASICRAEPVLPACEREDGMADVKARLAAVEALKAMRLPVGAVEQMIAESVPDPRDLADPPGRRPRGAAQPGSSITLI